MGTPGYGDSATWPAYSGHPNDPRVTEADEERGWIAEQIRIAEGLIGRAERALMAGDTDAARDLVRSAITELEEVAA